jgi:hypothetical protein
VLRSVSAVCQRGACVCLAQPSDSPFIHAVLRETLASLNALLAESADSNANHVSPCTRPVAQRGG